MAKWVGVQGQVKVAKKNNNTPTCSGLPSERQTESEKRFFLFQLEDLLNPWMVSIALWLNRLASYRIEKLCKKSGFRGT